MKYYSVEEIYDQKMDIIYKFFYFRTYEVSVAEDLTSQTFLIFVEKSSNRELVLHKPEKFLFGVMHKVWLRHLQEKYRQNELLTGNIDDFQSFVEKEVAEEQNLSDEKRVERFINLLSPSQRTVMKLRLIEQNTLSEICRILKKDMNYVKTTQKRAIKKLQELIANNQLERMR